MQSFFPNLRLDISQADIIFLVLGTCLMNVCNTVTSSDAPVASRSLVTLGVNRRHEILYNLGIQLLFSGRPVVAFDCLVEAVQIYHTNPRLWLRLAECCIVAFQLVSIIWLTVCLCSELKKV